ncbi:hypothetical protein NCPPB3778_63 [Rathayibacter phage NCPPB3778]|nr:hypothetical protein NCPPB3778_63 [Rathayibacter phage NCPPB3778]
MPKDLGPIVLDIDLLRDRLDETSRDILDHLKAGEPYGEDEKTTAIEDFYYIHQDAQHLADMALIWVARLERHARDSGRNGVY